VARLVYVYKEHNLISPPQKHAVAPGGEDHLGCGGEFDRFAAERVGVRAREQAFLKRHGLRLVAKLEHGDAGRPRRLEPSGLLFHQLDRVAVIIADTRAAWQPLQGAAGAVQPRDHRL